MSFDLLSVVPLGARYERRPIPEAKNALSVWSEAVRHFRDRGCHDCVCLELIYGTDDGRPAEMPTADEYARISALLDENRQAFDLIDDGIRRGRLQLPPVSGLEPIRNETRELVRRWAEIGQLRTIRWKFLFHHGDTDAAAAEAVHILRLGEMICNGEGLVVDYLVGVWLRDAGIHAVQQVVGRAGLATRTLQWLLSELDQCNEREDGLIQTERVELCCYTRPLLESTPDGPDIESLVDKTLEQFYDSFVMADLLLDDAPHEQISPEIREKRVANRRDQLLALLSGHPHPFDNVATFRPVAQNVAKYIAFITSTRRRRFWKLHAKWRRFTALPGNRSQRRVERIWPTLLSPHFPFDYFGDDAQAMAKRETLAPLMGWRYRTALKPPSEEELAVARDRLLQIDNPVGLILQTSLRPTEAASQFAFEYWQNLQAAIHTIENRLK